MQEDDDDDDEPVTQIEIVSESAGQFGDSSSDSAATTTVSIEDPSSQASQIVTVSFDDVSGEATVTSADAGGDSADAESAMMVMGVPVSIHMPHGFEARSALGSVKHACAGMKRAAGEVVAQFWGAVSGAGGSWVQGKQQQQQQQGMRSGRVGMMGRMMGPKDDMRIVPQ